MSGRSCNCGSSDMKSIKAISEQLEIKSRTTTVGGGFFGGKGGVGAARSYGNLSPGIIKKIQWRIPHKTGIFNILMWIIISFVVMVLAGATIEIDGSPNVILLGMLLVSLLVLIVKIVGRFRYGKKYDVYRRTWYCFDCGNFWVYKDRVQGTT